MTLRIEQGKGRKDRYANGHARAVLLEAPAAPGASGPRQGKMLDVLLFFRTQIRSNRSASRLKPARASAAKLPGSTSSFSMLLCANFRH